MIAQDRHKRPPMNASKFLLAAIFLTSGQALADGPLDICTTLATDTTGSLKAGYVSDGNELSTREFVLQYRNGKALVLASSGVCYPRVQTIARDVFLVSVENCGSAFLPEYWIARADRHTKSVVLLDYLSPYKFFAAEMKKDQWDTGHLRVRLLYAAQYQYPFQPAELGMLVSSRGYEERPMGYRSPAGSPSLCCAISVPIPASRIGDACIVARIPVWQTG
ncbi:hypothetical protein RA280_26925 [Cupriavidus sp. CV2]|uniref:hypothetical protein n=1 Tax=Cupriavidus ulmosensis TaxID=3065913 RepID=UPI00296AAA98|nr:hypothetical protein [Cupriavidus sp. CV2]MDW3685314.1 hypothetical protein [Cupriavidus sp. CV2]